MQTSYMYMLSLQAFQMCEGENRFHVLTFFIIIDLFLMLATQIHSGKMDDHVNLNKEIKYFFPKQCKASPS